MSIEDHLLDLVKGAKAMTESMVKTVEKVVEEIRKEKEPEAAKGTQEKEEAAKVFIPVGDLFPGSSFIFGVTGYKLNGDSIYVVLENADAITCLRAQAIDGGAVAYFDSRCKVIEEIRKDQQPATPPAEEAKVDRSGVYAVKDCPGPLFRYKEKIYRKATIIVPTKVCGVMGSEWVTGVWAVGVVDNESFLFLEDTEVVAVV